MQKDFWQKPFLMLQQNLRKIDAKGIGSNELAKQLIDEIDDYGGNAILANAGGIVAWYPTELSFQKPNEFLKGDFIEDILSEAHGRDMGVSLRLDISKQYDGQYDSHPDWFIHDRQGKPAREWEMLATCFNGPYWQKHNFELIDEILGRYDPDGFFYNSYRYRDCYCERCRGAFKEATGHELPERESWDDPLWREYVGYRYRAFEDYSVRLRDYVHSRKPDVIVALPVFITLDEPERLCRAGWRAEGMRVPDLLTTEAFNALGRPFPKWIYLGAEESRISRTLGKSLFVGITFSEVFASRRSGQPAPQLAYDIMQVAAHGGNPVLAVSGTFDQDDRKALPAAKQAYRFLKEHGQYYEDLKSVGKTMLYYSQKTMDFYGRGQSRERALFEYRGLYEVLVHNHLQFDVIHDGAMEGAKLSKYKTVILPNVACLDDDEIALIDGFVKEGGNLVATYETSLFDEEGRPRDGYGLNCLPFSVRERRDMVGSYLLIQDKNLLKSFHDVDLMALNGELLCVEYAGSENVEFQDLMSTPLVRNNTPEFAYWEGVGKDPGLLCLRIGKGRVVYLPWSIGKLYHLQGVPEYSLTMADLIDFLNGEREVRTNAPASVEVSLARGRKGLVIHLLNSTGQQSKPQTEVIPLYDITVSVSAEHRTARPGAARSLVTNQALDCRLEGDRLSITLPKLNVYEAISVT